jgi:hypothetical protein
LPQEVRYEEYKRFKISLHSGLLLPQELSKTRDVATPLRGQQLPNWRVEGYCWVNYSEAPTKSSFFHKSLWATYFHPYAPAEHGGVRMAGDPLRSTSCGRSTAQHQIMQLCVVQQLTSYGLFPQLRRVEGGVQPLLCDSSSVRTALVIDSGRVLAHFSTQDQLSPTRPPSPFPF